ncbi:MAG TPA: hypothetical protein VIL74_07615 [Pyrinomonadaceae bacterium]|jgi:hypothetical protein
MNTLSFKSFDQNGGSFELLIDEVSLAEQVDYQDSLIPYWIIDKGIPIFPPIEPAEKTSERIVAVCGCGEYGCDCLTCQVKIENDCVEFSDFKRFGYSPVTDKTFKFTKENFQEIERRLAADAEKIKKSFENKI